MNYVGKLLKLPWPTLGCSAHDDDDYDDDDEVYGQFYNASSLLI